MKLYKIRGTSEWVPWSVLYNERGYNSVPCIDMAYKSISPWGTSAGTGYRTNGSGDATYFVSGKTGWKLAFNLPEDFGVYPDEATPIQMIKDGVVSDAVWMEFFGSKWYLIQAEIANELYWIHELALPEYGWEIYEGKDYEFILVDGTTGRVVHGVEQLNEMVFAPTGYFTIEDTGDIVFVEQSPYPIVSHFHVDFDAVQTLADGAYIDTVLPYYTSKLYIAGIVDRVAETVVDFGLTVSNEGGYVRVTNNTGASVTLTRLAIQSMDATDAEVVEVVDGQDNHAYAFKWNDSGTPYWWISYSGERHWTDALGAWSEIPSIVLPEVVLLGNAEYDYWLYVGATTANITLSSGNNCPLYSDRGSSSYGWTTYPKAVISCQKYEYSEYWNVAKGRTGLSLVMSTLSGVQWPGCQNDLNESITFIRLKAAYCKNDSATVVTVYNSSNVAYNAFKFTINNTDYYYVLDGTQTAWTNDLSSIGYSLTPSVVLPTVTQLTKGYGLISGTMSVPSNDSTPELRAWDGADFRGSGIEYDRTRRYAIIRYSDGTGLKTPVNIFDVAWIQSGTSPFLMAVKNVSTISQTFYSARVAECSDSTATVVPVYNSSNVAYNAFKFTASGTDYYYVLDGTQTDWTDDLASIGYHLPPAALTAWFTSDKTSKIISTDYPGDRGVLYDSQGAVIMVQSGSIYTTVSVYDTTQQAISGIDSSNFTLEGNGAGRLSFRNRSNKSPTALYVEYTVS